MGKPRGYHANCAADLSRRNDDGGQRFRRGSDWRKRCKLGLREIRSSNSSVPFHPAEELVDCWGLTVDYRGAVTRRQLLPISVLVRELFQF